MGNNLTLSANHRGPFRGHQRSALRAFLPLALRAPAFFPLALRAPRFQIAPRSGPFFRRRSALRPFFRWRSALRTSQSLRAPTIFHGAPRSEIPKRSALRKLQTLRAPPLFLLALRAPRVMGVITSPNAFIIPFCVLFLRVYYFTISAPHYRSIIAANRSN